MAPSLRVLVIEDNEDDAALILRELQRGGYEPVARRVETPAAMHHALQQETWDVVLADWNLAQFSALFALEMLKSQGLDLPFIIVSGTIGEEAAISAMTAGGHDFVSKEHLGRLVLTIEREVREAADRWARRRAEMALATSEERLQLVARATNDAVRDWDLVTNRMWWNEGLFSLFGHQTQDIEADVESWFSRLHSDDKDRVIISCYAVINGGAPTWSENYRFRRADGTYAEVMDRGYIMRNVQGQALRLIGAITDLTAIRKAQMALQDSEEKFRTVADWTYDWEIWNDPQGRPLYISPAVERISGYRVEEFLADPTMLHRIVFPEDRARWDQHVIDTTNNTEDVSEMEFRILTRDGEVRWIDHICRAVYGSFDHKFLGRRASNRDITERKQAAKNLQQTEDQLRQAQKMEAVGQLAGGVAHDFNNLLTVIMGYTDLLMGNLSADAPTLANLEEIRNAPERASWLSRQLLAFSRRQILSPQVLDLNVLIGHFEKMLHRLIGEDVALKTELAPALARIKADPGQIEQITMNLAVNAPAAMPTGGRLTIETDTVLLDDSYPKKSVEVPPGRYVLLAISDTGCGMDAETQKRIFEQFFTTKEAGKGTGLGLSTVYGIVKQSNGFIWAYSEPGRGTTFKIYLPVVDEDIQAAKTKSRPVPQRIGVETILLVEDAAPLRTLTNKVLKLSGYTVLAAGNLDEALKMAEACDWAIHLLLTDVIMPGGSGPDVADRLKERCPDLRILYISGYTGATMAYQGILGSGSPLLQKPYSPDALLQKVREVLDEPR
jgi:two-component system, cell cycle sensor histidine kinase and response regulator CckA